MKTKIVRRIPKELTRLGSLHDEASAAALQRHTHSQMKLKNYLQVTIKEKDKGMHFLFDALGRQQRHIGALFSLFEGSRIILPTANVIHFSIFFYYLYLNPQTFSSHLVSARPNF